MYRIINLYVIIFLKFIIHKINSEIIKYGIVVLIGREKTNISEVDMIMD
jgi:hypothetical protein